MPPKSSPHGTANRWRKRCRCKRCRKAHNTDTRTWRRASADARLPELKRTVVLDLLRAGRTPAEAAETVGVTVQALYSRIRVDPDWGVAIDDALMTGRDPQVPHGTPTGYRHHRCRCPECRAAHHAP